MKREKSCGAVVYRYEKNTLCLLLLRHLHGDHWSFPKGHVEENETERQTALREVFEETGLRVSLHDGFRQVVEYSPKPGATKQVVYFLGHTDNVRYVLQVEEISEIRWIDIDSAYHIVTFKNDRNLIVRAREFLEKRAKA